jgi:hypothetical protein
VPVIADLAADHHRHQRRGVKSNEARSIALTLMEAPRAKRRRWLHSLDERDKNFVLLEVQREIGTLYGLWHDDPVGFIQDVLGETVWSRQAMILDAMAEEAVERAIIPAGFGVGKTYIAGRLTAWAVATNVVGSMVVVTTAPKMRQVKSQLWPHIKTAVAKGKLPGHTDMTQWMIEDLYGNPKQVAYGFSAAPTDESAMQGIHGNPKLFLIADEAGGLSHMIGAGTNNLLTGDAKLLAIGNPAMNEPGSWFEGAVEVGLKPEHPETVTIQISTLHSPAITGEKTAICRACVPNLDGHTIAEGPKGKNKPHLPGWSWLRNTLRDYGVHVAEDETDIAVIVAAIRASGVPYLIAKVLAEFPKDSGSQVMPSSWVEAAFLADEPMDHSPCPEEALCAGGTDPSAQCEATELAEGYIRLCDLGLETETAEHAVKMGDWVRLGVDVAADGGDEVTVYRSVGNAIEKRHASAGATNADANAVVDKIITEIDAACALRTRLGTTAPVRVKIDRNGLGWGVASTLQAYVDSGRLRDVQIIGVMVSESPEGEDPNSVMRPYRKRDEMWLAGRYVLQPDPRTGLGRVRLRVDEQCKVQLALPMLGNNSAGYALVESKAKLKARGVSSPDRAEGALLAIYEPFPIQPKKRRGILGGG